MTLEEAQKQHLDLTFLMTAELAQRRKEGLESAGRTVVAVFEHTFEGVEEGVPWRAARPVHIIAMKREGKIQ